MYEEVIVKFTESRANVYRVPVKQWRKWSPVARQVFNEVYSSMVKNREFFLHPKQQIPSRDHWKTTAWNAAWTSATAAS